jgi:hypothetical protein
MNAWDTSTWAAALVAAAAITLTYLFCIRPMMRARRTMPGSAPRRVGESGAEESETADVREEVPTDKSAPTNR